MKIDHVAIWSNDIEKLKNTLMQNQTTNILIPKIILNHTF
jgi:hypothetical protein